MGSESTIGRFLSARKVSKEGAKRGLLIRLLEVRFLLRPRGFSSAHIAGCSGEGSEKGSETAPRPPLFGLSRADWRVVLRAHAVGWILAGVVVLAGGCSDAVAPWELVAAIPLIGIFGFFVGTQVGGLLAMRRLRRELEEEGREKADLWKGGAS